MEPIEHKNIKITNSNYYVLKTPDGTTDYKQITLNNAELRQLETFLIQKVT
jgi:hypothetical protein